jgi:aminopeptidase YwaD
MIATTTTNEHVDRALGLAQEVIDACGPRLPGSEGDLKAADILHREMAEFDHSAKEEFTFAPEAFMGSFDILVAGYVAATFFLFFGGPWLFAAAAALTVGVLAGYSQLVFYWGWFDVFYRKRKGTNVIGLVNPDNEADIQQEVIVCGHHDSAWVVNFLLKYQKLYALRIILGTGVLQLVYLATIAMSIIFAATRSERLPWGLDYVKYAALLGLVFVFPLIYYRQRKVGTCGAGDNLIASAIALQIGKFLLDAKKSGEPLLKHTRIRVISFDAEEAGLKGSKAYVQRHRSDFSSVPTCVLCLECLYRMKDFTLLTSDLNGFLRSPPNMLREVAAAAKRLGFSPAMAAFPFGGGATDTASFLQIGVPAVTIVGMDTGLIRDGLIYHTPQDLVENIEREVVDAAMQLMLAFIIAKDREAA